MKKVFVLVFLALLALGSRWLWTFNERGFRNYAEEWFSDRGLTPPSFDCEMNHPGGPTSRSRAGRCEFEWSTMDLPSLESKLRLQAQPFERQFEGCFTKDTFGGASSSLQQYGTDSPPGPIFRGNTSTSLLRVYFNRTLGRGCIDLHYPYG